MRLTADLSDRGEGSRAPKRALAGEHQEHQDAEGEEVGARVDLLTAGLLRRHHVEGSDSLAGAGQSIGVRADAEAGGQAEIEDLHVPGRRDHDVGGF